MKSACLVVDDIFIMSSHVFTNAIFKRGPLLVTSSIIQLKCQIFHLHIFHESLSTGSFFVCLKTGENQRKLESITRNNFLNYAKVFNGSFCLQQSIKKGDTQGKFGYFEELRSIFEVKIMKNEKIVKNSIKPANP